MRRDATNQSGLTRRTVLGAGAGLGAAAIGAAPATAAAAEPEAPAATAAESESRPDFDGWLDGVDGGYVDARGQDEVTIEVGAPGNSGDFAFSPAGLWVDEGATVTWEWTGKGGGHNVHAQQGADVETDIVDEAGHTVSHTFEAGGVTTYQCDPHATLGMKGAVAVGDDVSTVVPGAGVDWSPPGGDFVLAFMAAMLGTAGIGALAVLAGEFRGTVSRQTTGPSSTYTAAVTAALFGLVLISAIAVQLIVAP